MDEWLARMIMVVEVTGIAAVSTLIGLWMKFRHQRRQAADQAELQDLRVEVAELRSMMETQLAELSERQDFADRLLAQPRDLPRTEGRIPTPV
jgi:hypothetical protein